MNARETRRHLFDVEKTLKEWGNDPHRRNGLFDRPPETPKHAFVKFCVWLSLRQKGHTVFTECKDRLGRVMDLWDLETGLNYEIQLAGEKKSNADDIIITDTIVIPGDECPDKLMAALKWVETYLT